MNGSGSSGRRSNQDRTAATRAALLVAARELFVEKGFAETGTPEIVAHAKVTRGALYHHFENKTDLFRAVVTCEAQAVAEHIDAGTGTDSGRPALATLLAGAALYFDAMTVPGRTRLLLLDGPAVLGPSEMAEIDRGSGGGSLRDGLAMALGQSRAASLPVDAIAELYSAAFDRAALAIANGADPNEFQGALNWLLETAIAGPSEKPSGQ